MGDLIMNNSMEKILELTTTVQWKEAFPIMNQLRSEYVALESGIRRIEAHRFYEEKFNYDKWCFSFRKTCGK